MRESLHDQPLEKGNVEVITATPLERKSVIVDFGTKLPAITIGTLVLRRQKNKEY